MFGRKSIDMSRYEQDRGQTLVSATTSFNGVLKSDALIIIHGRVEGEVQTAGSLLVGKQGQVQASVTAQNVAVAGVVVGNITASERLEIASTGKVLGDITTACLVIDEGGFFHGHSRMQEAEAKRPEGAALRETA